MKLQSIRNYLFVCYAIAGAYTFTASSALADQQVCRQCPFDCQGIDAGHKHCDDIPYRGGQCCVSLDGKGLDRLQEKDRENSGRNNYQQGYNPNQGYNQGYQQGYQGGSHGDRPGEVQGDCPNGFHLNDRKCNDDERRRGCMDQHSPSGGTCVGWRR